MGLVTATLLTLVAGPASAAPARPDPIILEQPNGAQIQAGITGDEWSNTIENKAGYTLVLNKKTDTWEYAEENAKGKLKPSGLVVKEDSPAGLEKHLSEDPSSPLVVQAPSGAPVPAEEEIAGAPSHLGIQPTLVILVDFNDLAGTTTIGDWQSRFFGATNSVTDYYNQVSYGKTTFGPANETSGTPNDGIVGWLRLPHNHPNPQGSGDARPTALEAIQAADPMVNFAAYDTNPADGFVSRKELHLVVITAGYETSFGGTNNSCGSSVWGHNGGLAAVNQFDGKYMGTGLAPPYEEVSSGYSMFGELHCSGPIGGPPTYPAHLATLGIIVHELGHDLNWPDLYDTDGSSNGIGEWSVMGGGSWTAAGGAPGSMPIHPDAFSKAYQGWVTPDQMLGNLLGISLTSVESSGRVLQLGDNPNGIDWKFRMTGGSGTGQYFLVENRQKTGYDAALPGCGYLVYHIDETRPTTGAANATDAQRLVDVEEADGLNNLDSNGINRGDAGDPFPGSTNKTSFSAATSPNSNYYGGGASGISLSNIAGPCAATMSSDISTPATAQFTLQTMKAGVGTGTIASDIAGVSCGADCFQNYTSGTSVVLTATPDDGHFFMGWSGGSCSGVTPTCTLNMSQARSVTATFGNSTSTPCTKSGNALFVNPLTGQTVTITRSGSNLSVSGGTIVDTTCGGATINNVATISVTGNSGVQTINVDGANGAFGPGDLSLDTNDINFLIDARGAADTLNVTGTTGTDSMALGASGMNLNGAADSDVDATLTSIESIAVSSGNGDDTITGAGGLGTGSAFSAPLTITGGIGNDGLTGGSGSDTFVGGDGNDTMAGGGGTDTVTYAASAAGVSVGVSTTGSGGDATGDSLSSIANLIGSAQTDTLTGNASANTLTGGDGNDTLVGGGSADVLTGGIGTDTVSYLGDTTGVVADLGASGTLGDAAGDTYATVENLRGGSGADYLYGDGSVNTIEGGSGQDVLEGRGADDVLNGEGGYDILSFATAPSGVVANLGNGVVTGGAGIDTISNFESIMGSESPDTLTTGPGGNLLLGLGGVDTMNGGAGGDAFSGGLGNDIIDGGSGSDAATYGGAPSAIDADLTRATPQVTGGAGSDQLTSIENVMGTSFDDLIDGDGSANVLQGGDGADQITGAGGNDLMGGDNGADILDGGAGGDVIFGHAQNDTLIGGTEIDRLDGGPDTDTCADIDLVTTRTACEL
ncbi:MAG: hypothetical protein QOG54_2192 [Actinomycetota bacterium]|nr:hypothetical protein [Actinomycetota bacterium]